MATNRFIQRDDLAAGWFSIAAGATGSGQVSVLTGTGTAFNTAVAAAAPSGTTLTNTTPSTSTTTAATPAFVNAAITAAGTGYAPLVGGLVPAANLPSYVDDVLEVSTISAAPAVGEAGKIYVAIDTGKTYRWTGSAYAEISASAAITVKDDGVTLTTVAGSIDFVGTGVTATNVGGAVTVTIPDVSAGKVAFKDINGNILGYLLA